jgi:polar amino acid transport system substrate-binding protein
MWSIRSLLSAAAALLLAPAGAWAQTCGTDYSVQDGDSLAKIATRAYGKSSQWTIIFYANQDRLGSGNSLLVPGLSIRIPCIGGQPKLPEAATVEAQAPAPAPQAPVLSSEIKRIQFLTATDYAPFTDSSLPNGGMVTDIVNQAMETVKKDAGGAFDYSVSWVNDWSAHLNPLLSTRAFDMGFPWYKPNCQAFEDLDTNAKFRCQKFFFSTPVFEEQVLVFLKADSPIRMDNDNELVGKKLCRPAGYWTFDLDDKGRNWVKGKKVTLLSPPSVEECLKLLVDGTVDAVPINELTGRSAIVRLDLQSKIKVIEKPLSILTLHVIIAKTHPNARTMLYYLNNAIDKLKASGTYDTIVEKHLQQFWDAQTEQAAPKVTSETAPPKPVEEKPADSKATSTAAATDGSTGTVKK